MGSPHSGGKGPGKKAKVRAESLGSPDQFTFTDVTDADLSTQYTSNTITVAGMGSGTTAAVTVAGATYSKNGGAYTSAAGTATNGDTFAVRHTSSAEYETAISTTLNIGGVFDTFTTWTLAEEIGDTTAPTITSADPSGSYAEGDPVGGTLTADETVTWSKSGTDAGSVTLNASTGVWSLPTTDYETKTSYSFTFTATDAADNTDTQAVSITITDVDEEEPAGDLTTPSVTVTTAAGVAPEVDIGINSDHFAGYYIDIQRSTTSDFAELTMDVDYQIQPSDIASGEITNAVLIANEGYSDPTGTYYQRYRIRREDGAVSLWVTITDTIA